MATIYPVQKFSSYVVVNASDRELYRIFTTYSRHLEIMYKLLQLLRVVKSFVLNTKLQFPT